MVCVGLVQAFCKVLRWGASVMRKPAFTAAEVSLTPPVWLGRARLIIVRVARPPSTATTRADQDEVDGGPGLSMHVCLKDKYSIAPSQIFN